jgi:hypothetical protein
MFERLDAYLQGRKAYTALLQPKDLEQGVGPALRTMLARLRGPQAEDWGACDVEVRSSLLVFGWWRGGLGHGEEEEEWSLRQGGLGSVQERTKRRENSSRKFTCVCFHMPRLPACRLSTRGTPTRPPLLPRPRRQQQQQQPRTLPQRMPAPSQTGDRPGSSAAALVSGVGVGVGVQLQV